ncbi:hypothetical protein BT93_F2765 [Corymbia citriodora subsp. variegata]|nr:hypothetical protein BT93_F2765 [Corymbia citriodora subsp. variegata]
MLKIMIPNFLKMKLILTFLQRLHAFEDIMGRGNQLCHDDVISTFRSESAARVVLMMIFSSCKYISSKARSMLCEVLNPNGERYLKQLLYTLKSPSSGVNLGMPNLVHIVISLIGLTCYLALPHYEGFIVESSKTLLSYMMGRSSESFCIPRSNYALHLKSNLPGRACCFFHPEEWEGKDVILFHNLWALSLSIHHSGSKSNCSVMAVLQTENVRTELVNKLLEICKDTSNCGARWFASYILTYFSYFGFPSELGVKIGKAFNQEDYADIELILADGTSFSIHGVLLMVRCPSLLPPEQHFDKGTFDDSSVTNDSDNWHGKFRKEIRLSSHVNRLELEKLLEYVYSGSVQAEENTVKRLKILARHCGLHHLSELLSRRIPEWATDIPSFDLKSALGQGRNTFWDIILESKATELSWTCSICSMSVPHMHVHRIILWVSCEYLQALLQSGMRESQSQILKVPVSWEALVKLVGWFYSSELPEPQGGCLWSNMGAKEKLHQLELYVELSWLADFWLLEDIQEACFRIVDNGLCSAMHLSVKILQMAANLSQWKLAEAAANHVAPSYRQLHESGELDELDETLIEMVRAASVRLSQSRG